jgi:hypothetical protein
LIRNGKIKQMTKDHSLVQELVDQGLLDKSEMESHPDKNVILRSLGVKPQVEVDVSYVPVSVGDVYLICSDGLSGPVSEQEMLAIVQATDGDLRQASERLIELANKYGGFDNITVQLVKVANTETATTDKTDKATLTGAFTQDQVAESIAKAKADREAKGGPGAKGGAKKAPAPAAKAAPAPKAPSSDDASVPFSEARTVEAPVATMPKTDLSVPTAQVSETRSGGGGGMLVLGLVLGIAIGGAGGFFAEKKLRPGGGGGTTESPGSSDKDKAAAEQAFKVATKAQEKASAQKTTAAYRRGDLELNQGKDAQNANDYVEARVHYTAATALFQVAGSQ